MTAVTTAQLYGMQIVNHLVTLLRYGSVVGMLCMIPQLFLWPNRRISHGSVVMALWLGAVYVLTPPAYIIHALLGWMR